METLSQKFGYVVFAATGCDHHGRRSVFAVGDEREVRNEVNSHGWKFADVQIREADDLAENLLAEARKLA